jgi:hypothetical protein
MKRHGKHIPQRKRVFVGCEGESERGYVALLSRFLEERHRRFHLDPVILGGGDPLSIVEKAERQIRHRSGRGDYTTRAIFLDSDRLKNDPDRDNTAYALAGKLMVILVWQNPCHEALILRHLPACNRLYPATPTCALSDLRRRWPDYEKNMPAARLEARLDRQAVLRAGEVEFLRKIEFGDPHEKR